MDGGVLENPDYTIREAIDELLEDDNLTFEDCEVINYDDLMEQVEAVAEKEIQQAQASIDATEMDSVEPDIEKREPTISFYVAECGEFHNMGEYHEGIETLEEAVALYPSTKESAARVVIPGANAEDYSRDIRFSYAVNTHPVMVNGAFRELLNMEQERSKEKSQAVSMMLYALHPDGTESVIGNEKQFQRHVELGGLFGVEKQDWMKYLENGEYLRAAEISEEQNYNMIDGRNNNRVAKKEEKTTDEKPSLLGRLKEKQEQLSAGAKKDAPAQSKKSERDMQ